MPISILQLETVGHPAAAVPGDRAAPAGRQALLEDAED